jgi:lipopolysaccharide biosynthesis protein
MNEKESHQESTQDATDYKEVYYRERDAHTKTKIKLGVKERELHDITQSKSYKIAKVLALSKHGARVALNHAKKYNPKRAAMIAKNKRHVRAVYDSIEFSKTLEKQPTADLAIVIHLYYTDMLPSFLKRLDTLSPLPYDLFVTVPKGKEYIVDEILKKKPDARVVIVPNCGRDVLPFIEVIRHIGKVGYTKVLKLHSKRSPHREDGEQWRDKIIESLTPDDPALINKIIQTLDKPNTAIVGPTGEYVSLLVNFTATEHHLKRLLPKLMTREQIVRLLTASDEYGFFAGTMFWARIDALMPIIDTVHASDFEPEIGQVDSTLAHALERLFNVVPELYGKDMYEIQSKTITSVDYHTTNIPSWSEVALDK